MRASLLVIVIGGLLLSGCSAPVDPQIKKEGTAAAEAWLALVDSGQYAASWEQASQLFRGAVEQDRWVQAMNAMRKPMGDSIQRELKSTRYRTTAPGAPDGHYLVIQFKSSFSNKKSATETVTPMRETNGVWRVSGYFIK